MHGSLESESLPSLQQQSQYGVESLPHLGQIKQRISEQVAIWASHSDREVTIEELYINGSYGAQKAHWESDIDITIGVTGIPDDQCRALTDFLTENLGLHEGWWQLDPCVVPAGPELHTHLRDCSDHGAYTTVYSLTAGEYEQVEQLNPA